MAAPGATHAAVATQLPGSDLHTAGWTAPFESGVALAMVSPR